MLIVKLTIPEAHVDKVDIDKIGHKDKASLARTLEQTLVDIQWISEDLHKKGQINKVQSPIVLKYVGQTFVRIGLLALERQKDGLEKEKTKPCRHQEALPDLTWQLAGDEGQISCMALG